MTTVGVRRTSEAPRPVKPAEPAPETERTLVPDSGRARRSWWCLLLAALLLPFANLQTLVPVVAWIAPVLLLRFTRSQRLRVSLPALVLVLALTSLVAIRGGFFPVEGSLGTALLVAGIGVGGALPYAVDRWVTGRMRTAARTLVFPTAVTAVEFLATFGNAFGTAGSTAYSQYASLPLVQLVSLTGIWGLTFLVSWFASVVNEVWEGGLSRPAVRRAALPFVVALGLALIFGGARLAFAPPGAATVRVAALAPDRELSDLAYASAAGAARTTQERAAVRDGQLRPVLDDLFRRSAEEARAGAKIVSWSEAAALVLQEDQPAVVARAAELARQERIYLQISMIVLLTQPDRERGIENENHAVLLDPAGAVVWDYLKAKPTPGDGHAPGPGVLPTVETPYGRLSTAICQDDFFPGLLRQAGRADVDILLLPSSDWESVAEWHAQQAPFRAVENGVSLVRATRQGTSLATDGQGRLLGHKADYFVADDQTLVTSVPTRGQDPAYAFVGDALAYLSVA
ncbi:MAG TPA: nitrilase-related carbon-nitrogen hydrolase, partial [Propionibacteriaceae bacterium]